MMSEPKFKYDVAISFLEKDADPAIKIDTLISHRVSTFIYPKKQVEVAGQDGEALFNAVFGKDSRAVIVLYRDLWGKTPWTRVEETAIRNRGFRKRCDAPPPNGCRKIAYGLDTPNTAPKVWRQLLKSVFKQLGER